ncbi:MAG TPA: PDZ domain-containing protein [Pyrinomonadaceae bacterium]|jgi:predicted metalloprotease with PDZ domain
MNQSLRQLALRAAALSALTMILCAYAMAEQRQPLAAINYRLSMSRPVSHLFEVSVEVKMAQNPAEEVLDFQMPKWSPGRYAVFDFAKNVQQFSAEIRLVRPDGSIDYKPWPSTRMDAQTWRVLRLAPNQIVRISYKVFGDDLSGTFSQLDERHANFNGGSLFMYIVDHKSDPVSLTIEPPAGWRIINGRTERAGQREWQFPNYDLLIDTPTEIGPDWTNDEFKVDGKTYHVMVHSLGAEGGKRPALLRDIEKIVRAETAMWGPPEFDAYTFLIHFAADDHSGDGMEHLTSTQIIEPNALADEGAYESTLDTVAHEFFHVWNVKRLRPVELGPWDFTKPLSTRGLWIAEGVTNYYGHLMQRRAGLWTDAELMRTLAQHISAVENSPGSSLMSAEEASLSAPFIDGAEHAQRTNLANTSISYYWKGEVLALVLDLLIRGKTGGKASLDDVMRRMYREFYLEGANSSYYLRGHGYNAEDFQRVASEVAGADLNDFFMRYVRGVEVPPYEEALAQVGLRLIRQPAQEPYMGGITLDWNDAESTKIISVRSNSPAENAGLKQGDVLVSVGKQNITRETWMTALNHYKQNERVPLTVKRDRRTLTATLTLGTPDRYDYRIAEIKNASATTQTLRTTWLKGSGERATTNADR